MPKKTRWDPTLEGKVKAAVEAATPDQQEQAFIHAADFIDRLHFRGRKLDSRQTRAWPRIGVENREGDPITGVPDEIQQATYLIAGSILMDHMQQEIAMARILFIIGDLLDGENEGRKTLSTSH